jgi:hypothetical protein
MHSTPNSSTFNSPFESTSSYNSNVNANVNTANQTSTPSTHQRDVDSGRTHSFMQSYVQSKVQSNVHVHRPNHHAYHPHVEKSYYNINNDNNNNNNNSYNLNFGELSNHNNEGLLTNEDFEHNPYSTKTQTKQQDIISIAQSKAKAATRSSGHLKGNDHLLMQDRMNSASISSSHFQFIPGGVNAAANIGGNTGNNTQQSGFDCRFYDDSDHEQELRYDHMLSFHDNKDSREIASKNFAYTHKYV